MPYLPLLQDFDVSGKRVLLRVDLNVPLNKKGEITDDTKIKEALPTISWLLQHQASVILLSHLGRPKNTFDQTLSLKLCANRISELLNRPILFGGDCLDVEAKKISHHLKPGDLLLLENLRFHSAEEDPDTDSGFVKALASLGDFYVNDAFGTAHRKHSSTAFLASFFPKQRAAGFLLQKEITQLNALLTSSKHPFFAIVGGAKISSKLGVLKSLLGKIDGIFIGGGMAYTFLKALGMPIGDSICEPTMISEALQFLEACKKQNIIVWLPKDFVIADQFKADAKKKVVARDQGISDGWQGMDIGPLTLTEWKIALAKASSVFWNGPVGVFEFPEFAQGTQTLATYLASLDAMTVVGGGDSVAAIQQLGLAKRYTHLSTGGGASLEFLEFGTLPGIEALKEEDFLEH